MPIRPADHVRDGAACAAIYAPFVTETSVSMEEIAPTASEFGERIRRLSGTHPFLVAEEDERVLGFAYGSPHRDRPGYRWAADVSIYLDQAARGHGLGRALYTELLSRLAAQGFWWACAGITVPNPASVGLHESLGFECVGVYRRIGWKLGGWRDVAWYQRPLRDPATAGSQTPPEPLPPR